MTNSKRFWKAALIVCLAAVLGVCCFFAGRIAATSEYNAQRELNIALNLSELEGLGEIDGTIYVTGHKTPDADTVCGSMAYAALLRGLGYNAVPVVLGEPDSGTEYILNAAGADAPMLLDSAAGRNIILVDHSEEAQSADELSQARILEIIDHHNVGTVTTDGPIVYDARPIGAASTIIWMRYRNYGAEPDRQTATLLLGAVLSDTSNLRSETTTSADREAVKQLSAIADIADVDGFYAEMYKASISYEGMSDEEIYYSDYKEYEAEGIKYGIASVKAYDEETALDLNARIKAIITQERDEADMDMAFAQVSIFHDDIAVMYMIPSDETAARVIEEAFPHGVFDGTSYRIEPSVSRKATIVPAFNQVLKLMVENEG